MLLLDRIEYYYNVIYDYISKISDYYVSLLFDMLNKLNDLERNVKHCAGKDIDNLSLYVIEVENLYRDFLNLVEIYNKYKVK